MLVNEFMLRSTFIQNEIETENTVTSRFRTPCKPYIQSSYYKDNNYNSNSRISVYAKNIRIKNDRVTKKNRHDAERNLNEMFHEDIEKQLKFDKIEYVTTDKPSDQLSEASKKYY